MDPQVYEFCLYLSVQEAAAACGYSTGVIHWMLKAGTLSLVRAFGSDIRISVQELKRLKRRSAKNSFSEGEDDRPISVDPCSEFLDGSCIECPECSAVYAETSVRYRLPESRCCFCECDLFGELSGRRPLESSGTGAARTTLKPPLE